MRKSATRSLFPRWSHPIRGTPAQFVAPLRWLALIPRLYAGLTFIPYGYDKVLGNNATFGMDAAFFRAAGVPFRAE